MINKLMTTNEAQGVATHDVTIFSVREAMEKINAIYGKPVLHSGDVSIAGSPYIPEGVTVIDNEDQYVVMNEDGDTLQVPKFNLLGPSCMMNP